MSPPPSPSKNEGAESVNESMCDQHPCFAYTHTHTDLRQLLWRLSQHHYETSKRKYFNPLLLIANGNAVSALLVFAKALIPTVS